ncbi:hypothetical protein [Paenibacillus monticola]|uniref:C1q domain-containing protein n=1 Tax=Paenibacillus monticola TaxID=2666075 RepID=A0A7X2L4G8_9BACL|nr:hypothetical protein [Paenibacillus monticola]MRN57037.1 hypothetical protein [Paenibacillus monticola]
MQTTGNLGLKKPEGTDIVDITDLNGNMDILDNTVNGKVDKISGKQLSTNDYTAAEKTKLTGIAAGANNYTHPNHTGDVTSTGDGVTAITPGVIVDADVNATAGIAATKIGTGVVSNTEFGYLDGVTSGIQAQLAARPLLTTTPQQTTAALTYYVRTDGNDSNTGLVNTAGGAFKTIAKAVSMIPQIVNHDVAITTAAGTYTDEIVLGGYSGSGQIVISGAASVSASINYKVKNVFATRNSIRININGFEFTDAPAIRNNSCVYVMENPGFFEVAISRSVFVNTAKNGVSISGSATVNVYNCEISNKQYAVFASYKGSVAVQETIGTGNTYRFRTVAGGRIDYFNCAIAGLDAVSDAGIIMGAPGIVNPWGDNTLSMRPAMRAYAHGTTSQALSAAVWTKAQFPQENVDNLSNYDPSLHRFTVSQEGIYQINSVVTFLNPSAGAACELYLYVNGAGYRRLGYAPAQAGTSMCVTGSASELLHKNDTVEIYVCCGSACNLSLATDSNFEIVRVA